MLYEYDRYYLLLRELVYIYLITFLFFSLNYDHMNQEWT